MNTAYYAIGWCGAFAVLSSYWVPEGMTIGMLCFAATYILGRAPK